MKILFLGTVETSPKHRDNQNVEPETCVKVKKNRKDGAIDIQETMMYLEKLVCECETLV